MKVSMKKNLPKFQEKFNYADDLLSYVTDATCIVL